MTVHHSQVQKLLARHKAEMTALQNSGIEDTRRALESLAAQHETALKALKDKMLKVGGVGCRWSAILRSQAGTCMTHIYQLFCPLVSHLYHKSVSHIYPVPCL